MPYTQHFIVEGAYLGSALREKVNTHGTLTIPASCAFFCARCGDLWARCPVDGASPFEATCDWVVWHRPCRKCRPHSGEVPGTLTLPWNSEFNAAFPLETLQRELNLHLQWWERQQQA